MKKEEWYDWIGARSQKLTSPTGQMTFVESLTQCWWTCRFTL